MSVRRALMLGRPELWTPEQAPPHTDRMKVELPPVPSDPLADALQVLRPQGAMYTRCHFTAPWGLDIPALDNMLMFHVVTAGNCWLHAAGHEPQRLQRGELALVPRGAGHVLYSEVGAPPKTLFEHALRARQRAAMK